MKTKGKMLILIALVTAMSCAKQKQPILEPYHINFSNADWFPEGMAYEPVNKCFIISSAAQGTVGAVTPDSKYTPVVMSPDLTSTTGIKVDKANARVWVCNVSTGIGAWSLKDASKIFFIDLRPLVPGKALFMNDEVLDPDGNVYATSSAAPVIFKITKDGQASVFYQNDAFETAPEDFGFNGIQYDKRGFLLVAHTASNKILKIPVNNPSAYTTIQLNAGLDMPDGLLLSSNGNQLVVVSGEKVLSFITDDVWKSARLSTVFNAGQTFPTSLTSDGNRVFVLYSHLDKYLSGQSQNNYTIQEVPLKRPDIF